MNIKVIVIIPWNLPILSGFMDGVERARNEISKPDWFQRRLDIWKRYTMPSLVRQSFQYFQAFLLCDPTTVEQNAILQSTFNDSRFQIINGSLYQLIDQLYVEDCPDDLIVCCRIDSDDMYHPNLLMEFFRRLGEVKDGKIYIQPMHGYALNILTQKVYRWVNPSPAFLCCPAQRRDLKSSIDVIWCDHGQVAAKSVHITRQPMFCVTLNGLNVFNTADCSWVGEEIVGNELDQVKRDYTL